MAKPIPEGYHTLTPYIRVRGAAEAIEFYRKAFGAEVRGKLPGPDGKSIVHAELKIGDSPLMLSDEFPQMGAVSPKTLGGTGSAIHIYVQDVDAAIKRAEAAGAKVTMPAADMFWGDRYGRILDPYGHEWSLATHKEDVTPEQMKVRGAEMMKKMGSAQGKS